MSDSDSKPYLSVYGRQRRRKRPKRRFDFSKIFLSFVFYFSNHYCTQPPLPTWHPTQRIGPKTLVYVFISTITPTHPKLPRCVEAAVAVLAETGDGRGLLGPQCKFYLIFHLSFYFTNDQIVYVYAHTQQHQHRLTNSCHITTLPQHKNGHGAAGSSRSACLEPLQVRFTVFFFFFFFPSITNFLNLGSSKLPDASNHGNHPHHHPNMPQAATTCSRRIQSNQLCCCGGRAESLDHEQMYY